MKKVLNNQLPYPEILKGNSTNIQDQLRCIHFDNMGNTTLHHIIGRYIQMRVPFLDHKDLYNSSLSKQLPRMIKTKKQ